jgi:membrane protein implicated in regulation of membrane protease activity
MESKVLNTFLMIVGGLVLALLAFIAVYVIGYSLVAIFSAGGMQGSTARAAGAGIAMAAAVVIVAVYLRARSSRARAMADRPHRKRAA